MTKTITSFLPYIITLFITVSILISLVFLRSPWGALPDGPAPFLHSLSELSRIIGGDDTGYGDVGWISDEVQRLSSISQALEDKDADQRMLIDKSQELRELSRRLEERGRLVQQKQKDLQAAVSRLNKEAKEFQEALAKLAAVNWEAMTRFLTGMLWISILAVLLIHLFRFPAVLRLLSGLLRLVRGVKGFGVELSFQERDTRNEDIHMMFQRVFSEMRKDINSRMHLFVQRKSLDSAMRGLVDNVKQKVSEMTGKTFDDTEYRCTIHVPDPLFDDYYCQMLDYVPRGERKKGRCFPIYFGIVGRTWRTKEPIVLPLTDDVDLVAEWGMTKKQVDAAAQGKRSYLCVPLEHRDRHVGAFYMDVNRSGILDVDVSEISEFIRQECHCKEITEALNNFYEEVVGRAPLIQISDPYGG